MSGRFITFEGIDGAGKSTQIAAAVALIAGRGIQVVQTREPGGTPLAEKLRELALHEPMHLETEALVMFAARREHLAAKIEPALSAGQWVVCDRFSDATYAYQVGGRGLAAEKFAVLEQWVHPHRQPDLTFLFDLDPAIATARMAASRSEGDRFEREQADFFARVRAAYLARARDCSARFHVLDATRTPDDIQREVKAVIQERFFA